MTPKERADAVVDAFQDIVHCERCGHRWPKQLLTAGMGYCVACRQDLMIVEAERWRIMYDMQFKGLIKDVADLCNSIRSRLDRIEERFRDDELRRPISVMKPRW